VNRNVFDKKMIKKNNYGNETDYNSWCKEYMEITGQLKKFVLMGKTANLERLLKIRQGMLERFSLISLPSANSLEYRKFFEKFKKISSMEEEIICDISKMQNDMIRRAGRVKRSRNNGNRYGNARQVSVFIDIRQ